MKLLWLVGGILIFHAVFTLILGRFHSKKPLLKTKPLVSIIIPAYQAEKTIEKTLLSVKKLTYPRKEIIVVNDSKDRTPYISKAHGIYCIQNPKKLGKSAAMNIAMEKARGEFMLFLDADTLIDQKAIEKMLPWFDDPKTFLVFPKFQTLNTTTIISKLTALENAYHSAFFRMHMFFGSALSFRGCCCLIRTSFLKKLGGWPEAITEDFALAMKIHSKGLKIIYEPRARVFTLEPETLKEFKKQKLRWGIGAGEVLRNRKPPFNLQFFFHFMPYLLSIFLSIFLLFSPGLFLLPLLFFIHFYIILFSENEKNPFLIFLFTVFYVPLVVYFYTKGMLLGKVSSFLRV